MRRSLRRTSREEGRRRGRRVGARVLWQRPHRAAVRSAPIAGVVCERGKIVGGTALNFKTQRRLVVLQRMRNLPLRLADEQHQRVSERSVSLVLPSMVVAAYTSSVGQSGLLARRVSILGLLRLDVGNGRLVC